MNREEFSKKQMRGTKIIAIIETLEFLISIQKANREKYYALWINHDLEKEVRDEMKTNWLISVNYQTAYEHSRNMIMELLEIKE